MAFDLRDRAKVGINDLGGKVTYGEALLLVAELRKEPGTRTYSSENGWQWSATLTDLAAIAHAEWFMTVHRKEGLDPITLPRPWDPPVVIEKVTPEERAVLQAQLDADYVIAST